MDAHSLTIIEFLIMRQYKICPARLSHVTPPLSSSTK